MHIGFDAKRAFLNNTGLGNYSRFVINGLIEHFPGEEYSLYSTKIKAHPDMGAFDMKTNVHKIAIGGGIMGKLKRALAYGGHHLDVFHGLSNELPFFAKRKGCRLVVSIHDLLFLRYPSFYPFIDRHIYLAKTRRACHQADIIIAISEQTKQDLIDFLHIDPGKIKVHYQSCHPQFLKPFDAEELIRLKSKYEINAPYIIQVGTLEERKNALLTLKAFEKSDAKNSFQLVLLGKRTGYCEQLYAFVDKHALGKKVKFIHASDFSDFPMLYQGASLAVYPSFFEGFGIPILEAMCSRTPVITSIGSCFGEVGGDAALYIDPNDPNDLQSKLDLVLKDEGFRQGMISKGATQASKFASQKLIEELMAIYTA